MVQICWTALLFNQSSVVNQLWRQCHSCPMNTLAFSVDQTFKLAQKEHARMMCRAGSTIPWLWVGDGRVMAAVWSMSGPSVLLVSGVACASNSSITCIWVLKACYKETLFKGDHEANFLFHINTHMSGFSNVQGTKMLWTQIAMHHGTNLALYDCLPADSLESNHLALSTDCLWVMKWREIDS